MFGETWGLGRRVSTGDTKKLPSSGLIKKEGEEGGKGLSLMSLSLSSSLLRIGRNEKKRLGVDLHLVIETRRRSSSLRR